MLHLSSTPSQVKSLSLFLLLVRAEFPVVLVAWKHNLCFTILKPYFLIRMGQKERGRDSGIHVHPLKTSEPQEVTDKYGAIATLEKKKVLFGGSDTHWMDIANTWFAM